ncbi:acyl-CoA dehydrogenase family protein [Peribacillus frigoritolerans]|uniref:acyl-CoA dehydrogenase family protein n=1 Tax=Peribacillus frigoritolerans TaxID=450367 RepID=UPI0021D0DBEC|nr:acyl-CoA dehydrogenase family protein [Peribacillus frigoritolerans]MCU6598972.1 acyl-CoA dehydrogenase family protein [Peribacillus frigoritolerans]
MTAVTILESHKARRTYFSEEHLMFRESIRKFLEKEAIPHFDTWEKEGIIPRSFWEKIGKDQYLCPWMDQKYGGFNLDFGFSIILGEELARVGAGLAGIGLHSEIVTPYIASYGTEEQKKKYLPTCLTGKIITAVAMTEPSAGSDLAQIKTSAIKDGDDYIVNGQKTFISNGIHADLIVLACKTDTKANPAHKGISLLLIEDGTPGFSRGRKLEKVGMHSQDTAELIFEDVRVPAANLLGEEGKGFYYLMNKLQRERIFSTVRSQVMAEEMLSVTLAYVKERQVFGQPLSKFQNTQFTLAEIATQVQLGRSLLDEVIKNYMNGQDVVSEVSMAKWWISDMARKIAPMCMQLHGGYGYMEEYKIARMYRDIAANPIFAGSNEIMKVIIAKNMGL